MISVQVDISNVLKSISDAKQRDIPFALANGLTQTAKQAQFVMQKRIRQVFTVRNTWTERGMRITPAKMRDAHPFAEVIADRWYLLIQDIGGEKVAHGGRTYIAVPIRSAMGLGKASLIPQRLKPSSAYMQKNAFVMTLHDGRKFIFLRAGSGRGRGRYESIIPMYRLVHEALVRPVLELEATVLEVVNVNFLPNFYASLKMFQP